MKPSSMIASPIPESSPAEQRLLAEIERLLVPFARATGTGLAYCGSAAPVWLAGCDACPCSRRPGETPACLAGPSPSSRTERDCRALSCETGRLLVCAPASQPGLSDAMEQLLATIDRQSALEQQEEQLLDELSASWESLEAVYEISSDLGLLTTPEELLERIIYRAAAYRTGLKAVLWLERDGIGHPLTQGVTGLAPRPMKNGLIGQVMAERNGLILNGGDRIASHPHLEEELRGASNLAVAPLTTRQHIVGALVVWQEEANGEFDSHDMRFLSALALQAAMVIENDRLHRAELESERLRQEIEIGSKIQQILLHGQIPKAFPRIEVAALSIPSRMIDGDFYDFIKPHEECLDVICGDVMGKGIPAALVGAATKSAFLRALSQLLSTKGLWRLPEPHEIVSRAHDEVVNQLIALESFVTLCYARFDLTMHQVQIVDCGHTATVRYRPETGACDLLKGVNLPIGFYEDEVYEQRAYPLAPGDLYFFYSDGLTEASDEAGEAFGEARLMEIVRRNHDLGPEALIAEMHRELIEFAGREALGDDLTYVAVRVLPAAAPSTGLQILSDPRNLGRCRQFAREACQALAPAAGEEIVSELELAINEAVANVMEHAYQEREDQPIHLTAAIEKDRIAFRICHQGRSFDPATAPPPAFDGSKDGGFGLFIIAHLVDEITYDTDAQGRHTVTMIKTIPGGNHGSNA
ncbi:MAG: SpoIIE family protein phosphatase [Blastocatellia bacterium]|nr:SpoIIE family protein phosphatase [Blastocatellia bacterium]